MANSLIINSPYGCPSAHWKFDYRTREQRRIEGRRQAGYTIADPRSKPHQDIGRFVPLPLVNQIRGRVDRWREAGCPGITSISKALLAHWRETEHRGHPLFFCQLEAMETLIWLTETPQADRAGIDIPSDGSQFRRLCSKLATGTGKTVVMAMLITWQAINRATYPQDARFSNRFFVVAPNLTVRERLAVLKPSAERNYYDEFNLVPQDMWDKLRQATIVIRNWHALNWETEQAIKRKKSVDKRGEKSDEAYTREVLGEMADARNLIVINDEAHHAWRIPKERAPKGVSRVDREQATKWIGGLDRIHGTRGILACFDFSATPFIPGSKTDEDKLFDWIVSDFGLNDAIESGLVKTPRIVVRDDALPDAKTYKSRLYHIYNDPEVRDDLNREAGSQELLPDLVVNAYALLLADWQDASERWRRAGMRVPPVMITVGNRTETVARIKHTFDKRRPPLGSLLGKPEQILHIDSKVLGEAEEGGSRLKGSKKEQGDRLREKVNTVGQEGKPGGEVENVISVGMLSEGWDAHTVTHIMGLRAFTSQLLCEQVVGRGLRRASYEVDEKTGLFAAEYVNVFGVPFSFLPYEDSGNGDRGEDSRPKIPVHPLADRKQLEISWPNVIRIDTVYKPSLSVDWSRVPVLKIDTATVVQLAEIAPTVDNEPDLSQISEVDLGQLAKKTRTQTLIFQAAGELWEQMQHGWPGTKGQLMAELVRLTEEFLLRPERIRITPDLFNSDRQRRQLVIALSMTKVMQHFQQVVQTHNTGKYALVLSKERPRRATGDMRTWQTGKPVEPTGKSHINYCVCDSAWEKKAAADLDRAKAVKAWVKNDHLGFEVLYVFGGVVRKYRPDLLIALASGACLVVEIKGQMNEQAKAKHHAMRVWVDAVNEDGRYGQWRFAVVEQPDALVDIL